MCALQALGAAYPLACASDREEALAALRASAVDSRWRVRESVAIGLQRLGEEDTASFAEITLDWSADPSPLIRRAVLAALAHPPILRDRGAAQTALKVAADILDGYAAVPRSDRRAAEVQVLKRGLEYAPSVLVAAVPDEGFAWLARVAASPDPGVRRIVGANLGKARLAARHPARVAEVLACLNH